MIRETAKRLLAMKLQQMAARLRGSHGLLSIGVSPSRVPRGAAEQ
jgi:hypothetical protein